MQVENMQRLVEYSICGDGNLQRQSNFIQNDTRNVNKVQSVLTNVHALCREAQVIICWIKFDMVYL